MFFFNVFIACDMLPRVCSFVLPCTFVELYTYVLFEENCVAWTWYNKKTKQKQTNNKNIQPETESQ